MKFPKIPVPKFDSYWTWMFILAAIGSTMVTALVLSN
jgi:hypothetical protein